MGRRGASLLAGIAVLQGSSWVGCDVNFEDVIHVKPHVQRVAVGAHIPGVQVAVEAKLGQQHRSTRQ